MTHTVPIDQQLTTVEQLATLAEETARRGGGYEATRHAAILRSVVETLRWTAAFGLRGWAPQRRRRAPT